MVDGDFSSYVTTIKTNGICSSENILSESGTLRFPLILAKTLWILPLRKASNFLAASPQWEAELFPVIVFQELSAQDVDSPRWPSFRIRYCGLSPGVCGGKKPPQKAAHQMPGFFGGFVLFFW